MRRLNGVATLTVRVSESLKARIVEDAEREGVSMNSWMASAAESRLSTGLRRADVRRLESLEREVEQIKRTLKIP